MSRLEERIRVLHSITNLRIGGAEILVRNILLSLNSDKFIPYLLLFEEESLFEKELSSKGVTILKFRSKRTTFNPILLFEIYSVLKKEKIDIVHVHLYKAALYVRIAGFCAGCKKIIFHEHGGILNKPLRHRIANFLLQIITDKFIYVSKHDMNYFLNYDMIFSRKKVKVLNNPCTFANSYKKEIKHVRTIGMIGQLHPFKGHEYAIRAFSILKSKGYEFEYLLVGNGELRKDLEKLAVELNVGVIFYGIVNNITEIYEKIDILIHPSLSEAFGMVIVEAMSFGIPVVATMTGGIPEIIKDKINGLLVPAYDEEAISSAIEKIVNDKKLRKMLNQNAFDCYSKHYSFDKYLQCLEEIYMGDTL